MTNPMTNKRNRISLKMDFFQSINVEYTELNYWEALEEAVEAYAQRSNSNIFRDLLHIIRSEHQNIKISEQYKKLAEVQL